MTSSAQLDFERRNWRGPMSEMLRSWNDAPNPEREFDCTAGAEQSLERADEEGRTALSIKNDWATVFADVEI
jgi:hypothetical protein